MPFSSKLGPSQTPPINIPIIDELKLIKNTKSVIFLSPFLSPLTLASNSCLRAVAFWLANNIRSSFIILIHFGISAHLRCSNISILQKSLGIFGHCWSLFFLKPWIFWEGNIGNAIDLCSASPSECLFAAASTFRGTGQFEQCALEFREGQHEHDCWISRNIRFLWDTYLSVFRDLLSSFPLFVEIFQ